MRHKAEIDEINNFVNGFSLESPMTNEHNLNAFSKAYRYVHTLLIWGEILRKKHDAAHENSLLLYFQELLSDLSASQFLLLSGLYKPARMMLRSSVENMLRVSAFEQGFLPENSKFTYELIALLKASPLAASNSPVRKDVFAVIDGYSQLCVYTHASLKDHLSLRIPLVSVAAFSQKDFNAIVEDISYLCIRYNRIAFFLFSKDMSLTAPKYQDYILDALPKGLKKVVAEQV